MNKPSVNLWKSETFAPGTKLEPWQDVQQQNKDTDPWGTTQQQNTSVDPWENIQNLN